MRPAFSIALLGLLFAACAEGEEPDNSPIGIAGSNGSSGDAGSFNNGGSAPGASGSSSTSGSGSGGSSGSSNGGATSGGVFNNGGTTLGGTTFGMSGSGGAMAGTGGAMGGAGGAMGGTGGKAAGGNGGAAAGAGGKATGGGGSGPVAGCPAKNTWTATAAVYAMNCDTPTSDYCGPPERAIDGMANVRFSTGKARTGTEWLQIDFKVPTTVKSLTLTTPNGDYTLAYEVRMSNSEVDIGGTTAIVTGTGQEGTTTITFPTAKTGRYLRINQTMAMSGWWSVYELDVTCE